LIRCESLQSLDPATCSRLLNKNYMWVYNIMFFLFVFF
jgi:uncharacterized membrane protein